MGGTVTGGALSLSLSSPLLAVPVWSLFQEALSNHYSLVIYTIVQSLLKMTMQEKFARQTWELANNIEPVNSADEVYKYNKKQQQDILTAKPWDKE